MNRTHKHSYVTVKYTTLEALITDIFDNMSLYSQEGLQRVHFPTHQTVESETPAVDT